MASVHEYKRFENNLVLKTKNGFLVIVKTIGSFFRIVGRGLTRQYTIVLVPHSEKKVYNFHVSVLSICCFFLALTAISGTFFWYGVSHNAARTSLVEKDGRLRATQASLDQIRDEVNQLLKEVRNFEPALSITLSALGADPAAAGKNSLATGGDLFSFFDIKESPAGNFQEAELRKLSQFLSSATKPIEEIGTLLNSQGALLTEIPSIWPIKASSIGHISMHFGQNENPFTGQYYIHKGIDISTYRRGDSIVATADGRVVAVDYDLTGFGNNVIIQHKHGFYTRYAHMDSILVQAGKRVQQGDVIGTIGNTGLSTGPHVHYEVHIGSDVVDPFKYMTIRSSIAKPSR